MRTLRDSLTLVLVALAPWAGGCGSAGDAVGRAPASASRVVLGPTAITVAPRIHLLGGLFPSVAYAVETTEGLVLIDSGSEPDAGPLRGQLAMLRLDVGTVRRIFLTHAHADHCGGAEALRAASGARVYAGRRDAPVIRAGEPVEALFSSFSIPNARPHATTVDVELEGGEEIVVGDARFRVLATPGHSPGSLCYLMERDGLRVLFTGDVVMSLEGNPTWSDPALRTPLGTYAAHRAPCYRGDLDEYLATLRMLRALPVPDLVLPGHPRMDPAPQSPRLTQERWASMLDAGIGELQALRARFAADGRDFLDGGPKELLPDLFYLGDLDGQAVYGFFAASRFVLVGAPGGEDLVDFVAARLRKLGREPTAPFAVLLTSCGAKETTGLGALVSAFHPRIVAGTVGEAALRDADIGDATIVAAEDLPRQGWLEVVPIPLSGRGVAPVAYRLEWGGRAVLFTGPFLAKPTGPAVDELLAELSRTGASRARYLAALDDLAAASPDLWLPAVPSYAQNANLYDEEWAEILARTRELVRENRRRP
jgi:glyoxylase-like metal-dependent hydrolase (beta-lactamase superfamily II)